MPSLDTLTSDQIAALISSGVGVEHLLSTIEVPNQEPKHEETQSILQPVEASPLRSSICIHNTCEGPQENTCNDAATQATSNGQRTVLQDELGRGSRTSEVPGQETLQSIFEQDYARVTEGKTKSTGPIDEERQATKEEQVKYEDGFDIESPFELLCLIDKDIQEGRTSLHPWQIQFMVDFAAGDRNKDTPFQAVVRTCNGSGKDKYIISACAVWAGMRYPYCRIPITSSSGAQLDNQTDTHINILCQKINAYFGFAIWKLNYRYYECKVTGSQMNLYATDEPGKAEGFHPILDGGKMCIFTSEAKSIPDEIFEAIDRCTGYTHRVDASSPGLPRGTFYDNCMQGVPRRELSSIFDALHSAYIEYKVTAYDCPHISANEIERMRLKMPKHIAASSLDAEFTTNAEMIVCPYAWVIQAQRKTEDRIGWIREPYNKGGLDLSAGGDETVLVVRNGNKHLKTIPFIFDNTEDTVNYLDEIFRAEGLQNPESTIYADVGGLGEPMLRALRARGWLNIRFVDNRNTPYKPSVFLNRGSESWWNLRSLLEAGEIILLEDDRRKNSITSQLSSRKYRLDEKNRIQLISKLKMKAAGEHSPDRADALVLAFWDYESKLDDKVRKVEEDGRPYKLQELKAPKRIEKLSEIATRESHDMYSHYARASRLKNFDYLQGQIDYVNTQTKVRQLTNK